MFKITFLNYVSVINRKFDSDILLETISTNYHRYSASEVNLIANSEYVVNQYLQIKTFSFPCLVLSPWNPSPANQQLYVNGVPFGKLTQNGILTLHERDIIEITVTDKEKGFLTHQIVVITNLIK